MPYPTSASRPSTAATSTSTYTLGSPYTLGTPSPAAQHPHPTPSPSVAAQGYTPKVSFDTFENPAASMFSYTLHVQSDGYARNRATRVFLCAASPDESGREALEWALECLVQDGDELIVFRGVDQEELDKDHELVREEARELMKQIQEKCVEYDPERKLSIILELIAGRPTTTLDRLIALYRPDSIVVGTRGQRGVMSGVSGVLGFGGLGSGARGGGVFSGESLRFGIWLLEVLALWICANPHPPQAWAQYRNTHSHTARYPSSSLGPRGKSGRYARRGGRIQRGAFILMSE
ncbi:hypothetical protein HYDPIDRAFT_89768 [Hydnomerulius pinastri MD-312]|uniref:UspA domain-containing protein n=1 Tax=Hydnomerulius pinastri MD-312 TaxID=994086 RepID=A0A0C9W1Y7_9AGAM|nr:hypothetical protein HYDPIDRAFT_89768 [Hydnomerulius pinastri MD-312]